MALTAESKTERVKALTRLALATREKVESSTYVVYVEDTAQFPTHVVVEACRRLEHAAAWFPKVAELIDECKVVATREAERRASRQLPAHTEKADPERIAQFLEDVKAEIRRKSMR